MALSNFTLEAMKKDIRRIRRSGLYAEVFGWILVFLAASLTWTLDSKKEVIGLFALLFIAGLFFINSGLYIKDGRGRRTRLALLANAIVSFPLCATILPIFICVQSANNFSRFNDLPDNIHELYSKPKPFRPKWPEIILLIV